MLSHVGMGMLSTPGRFLLGALFSGTVAVALSGCATGMDPDGGAGGDSGGALDGSGRDSGPRDSGVRDGMTPRDSGPDLCGAVSCDPFQYCDAGACRDYPACRGDGTCDRAGDVCHNRHCVPGDVDIDGDGSPASEDCDETDPARFPGNAEICNMVDDNCNEMIDEGDPAVICEFYPGGGICIGGNCGCPPGSFDLDRSIAGCECVAAPPIDQGRGCSSAIDLGDLNDSGQMLTVSGNVMPDDREVWYSFRAVDGADTTCDNFHVRTQFLTNPADTFELTVFKGDCATVACEDIGYTDFSWATDFRADVAGLLTGQCPCNAAGATQVANVSICEDDSANYFVRVRRRAGSMLSCDTYTIEISNGIYDTP